MLNSNTQKAIINTEKRRVCNISFYFCATKLLQISIIDEVNELFFLIYSYFLRLIVEMKTAETEKLIPKEVFECFYRINIIPRPSKREERMIAFLMQFGESLGLQTYKDDTGNVLIKKPASPGYEDLETLVLQSHMDMVCEKNRDVDFDFDNDAIQTYVEGDWLKAKGTTLGADDGIGVAIEMAILQSTTIEHGPIECLFTRDEETGLTGALGLEKGFINGKYLINLDSEDEGQIFVSCAGGARTTAEFSFKEEVLSSDFYVFKVTVKGLTGGHSGDDINKKRANANKILARYLYRLLNETDLQLIDIQSGGLHNAIPREGYVIAAVPAADKEKVRIALNILEAEVEEEYTQTEKNFQLLLESVPNDYRSCIEKSVSEKLIRSLMAVFNGIEAMSQDLDWLVETSSNLASVHKENDKIVINTSQRSSLNSKREYMSAVVRSVFELAGACTVTNEGYPGWKMNPDSVLLRLTKESYTRLFNKEPKILAIHAGLECGLFSEKYPQLDMVSFGPTLRGVHSPDEKLLIPTVEMVWRHLLDIMKRIPKKQ